MIDKRKLLAITVVALMIVSVQIHASKSQSGSAAPIYGPLYAGISYIKIPDADAAFTALLNDQIDQLGLTREDQITTAQQAGCTISRGMPEAMNVGFYFNFMPNHTIVTDLAFRKAVAHLLPRDELIATFYGQMATYAISFLPPSFGKWSNPDLEDFSVYDPALAAHLLDQAGYTLDPATGKRIDPATGNVMRTIGITYSSDWTVQTSGFAQRLHDEMAAVGIPVELVGVSFSTGAWWQAATTGDYDITTIDYGWGIAGCDIFRVWYDSRSPPTWLNFQFYNNAEFDDQMDILLGTLNETAAVEAVWRAQEIVAEDVAYIPGVYPVTYIATSPQWTGMIEWYNWPSAIEDMRMHRKDGDLSKMLRLRTAADPASFIVGYDMYSVAYNFIKNVCGDAPFENNPTTGPAIPWFAKTWALESWSDPAKGVTNGAKLTVKLADNLTWHDGFSCTADDYAFNALYARDKKIPRPAALYANLVDAVALDRTTVVLYYSQPSLSIIDNQGYVFNFPKHLYNDNVTLYGEPAGPMSLQVEGQHGVPDPSTFYAYKTANPFNSSLTCLVGIGLFTFPPGGYQPGVSTTFLANRQYFKSVPVTDTNLDFKVNILDIAAAAKSFGTKPGDTRWAVTADINGDSQINIIDIASIAKDFGKTW